MVKHQLTVGLRGAAYRWGERESTKILVIINVAWRGFEKQITKIEAHAGMAERLVRDLAIEESLQIEIKDTL